MQRYREIHDSLHVLLGYGVSVPEELAVKWYEMSILGLPSSALSSFFGPLNVVAKSIRKRDSSELAQMTGVYLPHVLACTRNKDKSEFFMNVYFEKEFETKTEHLRERLGIIKCNKL